MSQPKFTHPFTLAEAMYFEVGTITEEISRLQNSLKRLNETQIELEAFLKAEVESAPTSSPDPDILDAIGDNRVTIAAQTERIDILRLALERKGATPVSNTHYNVPAVPAKPSSSGVSPLPTTNTEPESEDSVYL